MASSPTWWMMSDWTFDTRADMKAVLRLELPADIVDPWLDRHLDRTSISYCYVLFAVDKIAG